MPVSSEIEELRGRLISGEWPIQLGALEEATRLYRQLATVEIEGYRHTDNPVIYAERLAILGPSIVPELEALYESFDKGEPKTALGILLLHWGSSMGLAEVLEAVETDGPYALLATMKLAKAGAHEASRAITNLMRRWALEKPIDGTLGPNLKTLTEAMCQLGVVIPTDVRRGLEARVGKSFISLWQLW